MALWALDLARDWALPAFALRQALAPAAGCPPCHVVCAACPPVTCGSLSCSGQASTGAAESHWGWTLCVLVLGIVLGGSGVFFGLRRFDFGAPRPAPPAARATGALRGTELSGGAIVAVTPSSKSPSSR